MRHRDVPMLTFRPSNPHKTYLQVLTKFRFLPHSALFPCRCLFAPLSILLNYVPQKQHGCIRKPHTSGYDLKLLFHEGAPRYFCKKVERSARSSTKSNAVCEAMNLQGSISRSVSGLRIWCAGLSMSFITFLAGLALQVTGRLAVPGRSDYLKRYHCSSAGPQSVIESKRSAQLRWRPLEDRSAISLK